MGGALAELCAYDLLVSSRLVRRAGQLTVLSFAAPRMFNEGFQAAMGNLEALQMLTALRVMVAGDMIPRLPPRQLGGCHRGLLGWGQLM